MGSKTFSGVRFMAYPDDHSPPHIHATYAGIEVIVDLIYEKKAVRISDRIDAIRPATAKRSDISHIRSTATKNFGILVVLWQEAHDDASH